MRSKSHSQQVQYMTVGHLSNIFLCHLLRICKKCLVSDLCICGHLITGFVPIMLTRRLTNLSDTLTSVFPHQVSKNLFSKLIFSPLSLGSLLTPPIVDISSLIMWIKNLRKRFCFWILFPLRLKPWIRRPIPRLVSSVQNQTPAYMFQTISINQRQSPVQTNHLEKPQMRWSYWPDVHLKGYTVLIQCVWINQQCHTGGHLALNLRMFH